MDVKSTCNNSPGPLHVRGLNGATGGAASNFLAMTTFSDAVPEVASHARPPESFLHER